MFFLERGTYINKTDNSKCTFARNMTLFGLTCYSQALAPTCDVLVSFFLKISIFLVIQSFNFKTVWKRAKEVINPFSVKRGLNASITSFPHNPDFWWPYIRSLLKILWEKEKMLVTSIFSFSHDVFYPSKNNFQFWSHIYFVTCKSFQFGLV